MGTREGTVKKPEDVTAEDLDTMAVGALETVLVEIEEACELDETKIEAATHALTYIDNELPELRLEVKRLRKAALALCISLRHWHDGKMECDSAEHEALENVLR